MTSKSDNSHVIPIEANKKILEIVCSPTLKYVAALHEDSNIDLWSINSQGEHLDYEKTINIGNIHTRKNDEKIFAISDNKYVSISFNRINPYNFKIFDFETEKEVTLKFPDWQKEIDFLSFIDNDNIIMVNTKYYRAYVFSSKDTISWVCKSMVELKYFKNIYIKPKGKLIIFNDSIYELTVWDIEELSITTRVLIDWNLTPKSIEISDDEELLLVCARNEKTNKTYLYSFSTETGMNLSSYRFHLIASKKGERLLYMSGKQYNLMDPYSLKTPTNASKLFERIQIQIQEPYIILSDKIIYTIDGRISIKELVTNDWVKFLRKELKSTNRITTLSKKTIDSITDIINGKLSDDHNIDKKEFKGEALKWGLELDDESVRLTIIDYNYRKNEWNPDDKKKHLDILPSFYSNGKEFIQHCNVLENDDFITITRIGIIIWTYKYSEIKMHYYWNYWNDRLEQFEFEMGKFKDFSNNWTLGRILPASSYETIYRNLDVKFGKEEIQLFKIFLEDNIVDEFYLTCYGKILMEIFINLQDDKWIRYLGGSCMDKFVQDDNHLISKISLLTIIFENFNKLSEHHPAFIESALSLVGFVVPSYIIEHSIASHLSSYGRYYHLSKTSFLDILTSNLWIRWISFQKSFPTSFQNFQERHTFFRDSIIRPIIDSNSSTILAIPLPNFVSYPKDYNVWKELLLPSPKIELFYMLPHQRRKENWFPFVMFYECHTIKLREHIIDIENNKWAGYKKPYISKNLKEVLLLPEEQPTLAQINEAIKGLKKSIKELKESTKEPSLRQIKEDIKDLKDQLK
ncbi:17908_t:CDS:2, partial [Racocetra persica]